MQCSLHKVSKGLVLLMERGPNCEVPIKSSFSNSRFVLQTYEKIRVRKGVRTLGVLLVPIIEKVFSQKGDCHKSLWML
jgi:hypothetical protein